MVQRALPKYFCQTMKNEDISTYVTFQGLLGKAEYILIQLWIGRASVIENRFDVFYLHMCISEPMTEIQRLTRLLRSECTSSQIKEHRQVSNYGLLQIRVETCKWYNWL